jgi:hypothetical protein
MMQDGELYARLAELGKFKAERLGKEPSDRTLAGPGQAEPDDNRSLAQRRTLSRRRGQTRHRRARDRVYGEGARDSGPGRPPGPTAPSWQH